jgi:hypothetical protein
MRTALTRNSPLAGLSPVHRLVLGSALATIGGATIMLSLLLGWNELARPWGFLVGFAGGLTGGAGVAIAVCGLFQCGRHSRWRGSNSDHESGV